MKIVVVVVVETLLRVSKAIKPENRNPLLTWGHQLAHYVDIGIVNIITQRLKDIELQRWLSEINNDTRKDANQSNKMETYRLLKTVDNC